MSNKVKAVELDMDNTSVLNQPFKPNSGLTGHLRQGCPPHFYYIYYRLPTTYRLDSGVHVTFARLIGRKHAHRREEKSGYRHSGDHPSGTSIHTPLAYEYHHSVDNARNSLLTLTNATLLEFSTLVNPHGTQLQCVWTSRGDFNSITGHMRLKAAVLDRWLTIATRVDWHTLAQ
jgi:hypothetical protein